MTLDQSLANLQHQADRLANLFASTADAIEARTASAARAVSYSHHPVAAEPVPAPRGDHWNHVHEGDQIVRTDTPAGVVATKDGSLLNFEGENYVPQTPQGPAPSSAPTTDVPASGAVEVEGPAASPAPAPGPADTSSDTPPWQGAPPSSITATAPAEKKTGRRTNEELAADLGVNLDDVKRWKGGGRISKADMEEFKRLHPEATTPAATAPQAMPTEATPPFGDSAGVPAAAAPVANQTGEPEAVAWPTGPDGQPAPVSTPQAPVAPPAAAQPQWTQAPAEDAPGAQFSEYQPSESAWDPFKA